MNPHLQSKTISVNEAISTLKQFRYGDQFVDSTLFNELIKNLAPKKVFNIDNFQQMLPDTCPSWKTLTSITFSCTYQYRIQCVDVGIIIHDQQEVEVEDDDARMRDLISHKLSMTMDSDEDYQDSLILEMFTDELLAELIKHRVELRFEGCDTGSDS